MDSHDDDDGFEYYSSQDYADIDHQIDSFEIRQYYQSRKEQKQRMKIPSYSIRRGTYKSQHPSIKISGLRSAKNETEREKLFRYCRYLPRNARGKMKVFDCDKRYRMKHDSTLNAASVCATRPIDFNTFRQQFYQAHHLEMKSIGRSLSMIEMTNISPAPISKKIQDEFMSQLNNRMFSYPHLVYHGASRININGILRHGFLVRDRSDTTKRKRSRVHTRHQRPYRYGVDCSDWSNSALSSSYSTGSNIILACATLRGRPADSTAYCFRSDSVILHTSEVIPMFIICFRNANYSSQTQPWLHPRFVPIKSLMYDGPDRPFIISRKYLRKLLNCFKDQVSGTRPYRERKHRRRNKYREDRYQTRVFETFGENL